MPRIRLLAASLLAAVGVACHPAPTTAPAPATNIEPTSISLGDVRTTTFGWTVQLFLTEPGFVALFAVENGRLRRVHPDRGPTRRHLAGRQRLDISAESHPASVGLPYGTATSSNPMCAYQIRDGSEAGYRCVPGVISLGHLATAGGALLALLLPSPVGVGTIDSLINAAQEPTAESQLDELRIHLKPRAIGGAAPAPGAT